MQLDGTICYCSIRKRKILNSSASISRVHDQISEYGGAGTGCGWCVPYLKRYFEGGPVSRPIGTTDYEEYARISAITSEGKGTPAAGAIRCRPKTR